MHLALRMTREEAEAALADPDAPECLVQAASWVLVQCCNADGSATRSRAQSYVSVDAAE